jgi:Family of unknown function (DUF6335)
MASRHPHKRSHPKAKPMRLPEAPAVDEGERRGVLSGTAVAIEALRSGIMPFKGPRRREDIPREDELILVGDPDDRSIYNEYVGDETPGGSASTPDQSLVDDIGRAYGLQEEDAGELQSAGDVLERRDRHRSELQPPRRRI